MKNMMVLSVVFILFMLCSGCGSEKIQMMKAEEVYNEVMINYTELRRVIYDGDVEVINEELFDEYGMIYFQIEEEPYDKVSDIQMLMEKVFTNEYIDQKMGWVLEGKSPMFKEIEGRLCIAMKAPMGGDIATKIDTIINFDEDNILEIIGYNYDIKFKVSLRKKLDNWLIFEKEIIDE